MGLYCLLTEISSEKEIKMKQLLLIPLKMKVNSSKWLGRFCLFDSVDALCDTSMVNSLSHVGTVSYLASLFLGKPSGGSLPVLSYQVPILSPVTDNSFFLNQRKVGKNQWENGLTARPRVHLIKMVMHRLTLFKEIYLVCIIYV